MTQETATSVKHLALPCFNAIKAIAGSRECEECKGTTKIATWYADDEGKHTRFVDCPTCSGTGKVKWEWKPQVGDWVIAPFGDDNPYLITNVKARMFRSKTGVGSHMESKNSYSKIIPIIPWEMIVEILKGAGYRVCVLDYENYIECLIYKGKNKFMAGEKAKSRQEAVCKAVIALAKELST